MNVPETSPLIGSRADGPSFKVPVLVVIAVMIFGTLLTVVAGLIVLPLGVGLAYVGIPYTMLAVVLWGLRRALIRPLAPGDSDAGVDIEEASYDRKVQAFGLFSQRASFVSALALLGLLALAGLTSLGTPSAVSIGAVSMGGVSDGSGFPVWALGGAITAGAFLAIAVNMPQLYFGRIMALERHAVATRTGAWRWIVVAWVASPVMWVAYSATSLALLVPPILR